MHSLQKLVSIPLSSHCYVYIALNSSCSFTTVFFFENLSIISSCRILPHWHIHYWDCSWLLCYDIFSLLMSLIWFYHLLREDFVGAPSMDYNPLTDSSLCWHILHLKMTLQIKTVCFSLFRYWPGFACPHFNTRNHYSYLSSSSIYWCQLIYIMSLPRTWLTYLEL